LRRVDRIPPEIYDLLLQYAVNVCVDLIIAFEGKGLLFVKRKKHPYKALWATVGGRMHKGETFNEAIERIAKEEVGLEVRRIRQIGAFTTQFKSQYNRHDVTVCFWVKALTRNVRLDESQNASCVVVHNLPKPVGKMYVKMIKKYREVKRGNVA